MVEVLLVCVARLEELVAQEVFQLAAVLQQCQLAQTVLALAQAARRLVVPADLGLAALGGLG